MAALGDRVREQQDLVVLKPQIFDALKAQKIVVVLKQQILVGWAQQISDAKLVRC